MTSNIPDEDLYRHANRVSRQVIVITGGASGIGRAAVLELAKRGAKVVIGDINAKASEELVHAIRNSGGTAMWKTCNVLDHDDQVRLFEFALEEFGSVDVVIANAGIGESEKLVGAGMKVDELGHPTKPMLKTVQMDYVSVIYRAISAAQLAFHYFSKATNGNSLKTLVLTASMLSFAPLQTAPQYTSSKYAVLSLMRSLTPEFQAGGFRIATVHPWFVGEDEKVKIKALMNRILTPTTKDTPLVPERMRNILYGVPLSPMYRVAGAIVFATTDTLPESNGAAYTIPDEREVFRVLPEQMNDEVFTLLNNRARRARRPFESVITFYALIRIFAGRHVGLLALPVMGYALWNLSLVVLSYRRSTS